MQQFKRKLKRKVEAKLMRQIGYKSETWDIRKAAIQRKVKAKVDAQQRRSAERKSAKLNLLTNQQNEETENVPLTAPADGRRSKRSKIQGRKKANANVDTQGKN